MNANAQVVEILNALRLEIAALRDELRGSRPMEWLTRSEYFALAKLSASRENRLRLAGLSPRPYGNPPRWRRDEVEAWMAAQKRQEVA